MDFDRFQKGDVSVTRTTSPIWTPLSGIGAEAVDETSGPAANSATNATRVIPDGTPIVVAASAGIAEL